MIEVDIMKKTFQVKGMHCHSCETLIKDSLEEANGVRSAKAFHEKGTVEVDFDESKINDEKIIAVIKNEGYEVLK
jgi:copper chaperone